MNIEVEVEVPSVTKRKVVVSLPAYYKHNMDRDDYESCIYGMVDETFTHWSIHITRHYFCDEWPEIELRIERRRSADAFQAEYQFGIEPQYRSSKEEFEAALAKAREAIPGLLEFGGAR